jgi:anti-anti-sigma factor
MPGPHRHCICESGRSIIGEIGTQRGSAIMEVSYVHAGEALIVSSIGRVDESTWEEFGAQLMDGIDRASAERLSTLIVDLSGIDYMSSRGLRVLTQARQRGAGSGVTIRLASPNEVMREILAISRYDRLFDVDDALPSVS